MELLDCTLRDGGYYNNWDFTLDEVVSYLDLMRAFPVSVIEIGFRGLRHPGYRGVTADTSDEFLEMVDTRIALSQFDLAVMVNTADIVSSTRAGEQKQDIAWNIDHLFPLNANDARFRRVRITFTKDTVADAKLVCSLISEKGYVCSLNLMRVDQLQTSEVVELAGQFGDLDTDVFAVADSFGSLIPDQANHLFKELRNALCGRIGFHAHDNSGLALANCMEAVKCGVDVIDSTLLGMGRGAGNVCTEELLVVLSDHFGIQNQRLEKLFTSQQFSKCYGEFEEKKRKYKWGKNFTYLVGAKKKIHPTLMQTINTDNILSSAALNQAFLVSSGSDQASVDSPKTENVQRPEFIQLLDTARGKPILILGRGASLSEKSSEIEYFIDKFKPFLLTLNNSHFGSIPADLLVLADAQNASVLSSDLTKASGVLINSFQKLGLSREIINKQLEESRFITLDQLRGYCEDRDGSILIGESEERLGLSLSLYFGWVVGNPIYVAGFDGFLRDAARNLQLNSVITKVEDAGAKITSITPSILNFADQRSVFACH